jgi:hypothetical protein
MWWLSRSQYVISSFDVFRGVMEIATLTNFHANKMKHVDKIYSIKVKQIPLTPMGVLAPGSAHVRPSAQPPIDVSGNFPAHMSGVGG